MQRRFSVPFQVSMSRNLARHHRVVVKIDLWKVAVVDGLAVGRRGRGTREVLVAWDKTPCPNRSPNLRSLTPSDLSF